MSDTKYEFPTEIVDLPSKGLVYPEGHPLRKGNVEIKYMTAREEDILASQSLIKKGVVLDKLFESVVVEKGVDINEEYINKVFSEYKIDIDQANSLLSKLKQPKEPSFSKKALLKTGN